ncbi:putative Zinc finger, RING/FYVE/PHD-type [Rosa chinensis]|uniref:Putative Zinc finger, RING/FYVE/PHD-type n=1 Tax=Rosa chinensis TaxID=74649 RepID=A0A2P6RK09_ROSCH|nr:PHD finger protein MALE MEIOCYTE DEATH 1 [Rosa chinensis]PRQ46763.1 putative Zinc finger, RING/FYVE/PHD-type [Rosa chinensis]
MNAYAHLLWIQRSSSGVMSSSNLMDIWDCLCKNLEIRDVTLEDVAKKGNVDLRLLCGVAYGRSWFGRWGYKFWRGSYGVDEVKYEIALACLCNLDISQVVEVFRKVEDQYALVHRLKRILECYESLSPSPFKTLSDLLTFMLTYPAKSMMAKEAHTIASIPRKSWTRDQIKEALMVLINILDKRGPIRGEDLSEAASSEVSTSELLDYAISTMKNLKCARHQIVACKENPISNLMEYGLETLPLLTTEPLDVHGDAVFVYETVVLQYPEVGSEYSMVKLCVDTMLKYNYLMKGTEPCCKGSGKKVECKCGMSKDDGERFLKCNLCEVYEYLKCSGMDKTDTEAYVHICDCCLTEQKEKQLVAEAKEKSKAELDIIGEDEVRQT